MSTRFGDALRTARLLHVGRVSRRRNPASSLAEDVGLRGCAANPTYGEARWASKRGPALTAPALAAATLVLALAGCASAPEPPPTAANGETPAATPAKATKPVSPATQAAFEQGLALLKQARYQQAADLLQAATQADPQVPGLLVNLAIAYIHLDRQQDAKATLTRALQVDPGHPVALNWLAIINRREGRFADARSLYERLVSSHPDSGSGHLNLGILCDLYLHQPKCALEHYQRYQALAGTPDPEVAKWITDLERRVPRD